MTLRVLIIEDDPEIVGRVSEKLLERRVSANDIVVVANKDDAISRIQNDFFDITILDIRIPYGASLLDPDPAAGIEVLTFAVSECQGTPLLVLTATDVKDHVRTFLRYSEPAHIWTNAKTWSTINFYDKEELYRLDDEFANIIASVRELQNIELIHTGFELTVAEKRILTAFLNRRGCRKARLTALQGGLSDTKVLRLVAYNADGSFWNDLVVKIGRHKLLQREDRAYNEHVIRLEESASPRLLEFGKYGGGVFGALFYRMIDRAPGDLFNLLEHEPAKAAVVVKRIQSKIARWSAGVPERSVSLRSLRQICIDDTNLNDCRTENDLQFCDGLEELELQARYCCIHGDLHGGNVLVTNSLQPILIDFASVENGPIVLDPVTLELSAIFHPRRQRECAWLRPEDARSWFRSIDDLAACPIRAFVKACRKWGEEVGAGKREYYACCYSYLLRQLKYEDVNRELCLAFLREISDLLRS